MKTIKQKILASFLILVGVAVVICGAVGILTNYTSANSMMEKALEATAPLAAGRVSHELAQYKNMVENLGIESRLSDEKVSVAEKQEIVNSWAKKYGMVRGNLLDQAGNSLFDGNSYADREYVQGALAGNVSISTPTIRKRWRCGRCCLHGSY